MKAQFAFLFVLLILCSYVIAHEEGNDVAAAEKPGKIDMTDPSLYVILTSVLLIVLTVYMLFIGTKKTHKKKKLFFWMIVVPVVFSSLYLAGHTIYENSISETKGPVHWHADYEVWVCGNRLDLIDPKFPENKIGSPLFHEHNDDRMHVEGTIIDIDEVNLESYFKVIGGELHEGHLRYNAIDNKYDMETGDLCNGEPGSLKVYINGKRTEDYEEYIIYPNSYVPPGDCIIVSFDETNTSTTEKICESWVVKGWNYQDFKRPAVTIGDRTWQ